MTAQQDRSDNKWQWFFTFVLSAIMAMNGYIVNKIDAIDQRQNMYIERIRTVEMQQQYMEQARKNQSETLFGFELRLQKLEAIMTKEQRYKYNLTD